MKRYSLLVLCLELLLLLSSCAAAANPLERAEATPVPGLPLTLHSAKAPESNADKMEITLFYRYQQTNMLASETRIISVPRDESPEMAAVRQLLAGPQASHTELTRLFPHNTSVVNVNASGDTLFITLSEDVLNDGIPQNWNEDPVWRLEAPLKRKLTMQSLAATMTENFSYPYVQLLIAYNQTTDVSTRLDNAYFLDGRAGLSERMTRDEEMLLTMQNTAEALLLAWQLRDFELLYQFTYADERPAYSEFVHLLENCALLTEYTASAGHTSGSHATVTLDLTYRIGDDECRCPADPLRLVCDDGVWKIRFGELQRLMNREN